MGEFIRERLPEPVAYFEERECLPLVGRGKWRTACCRFHDGSDSMRINTVTGAWVCMSCGVKGGDVLAYHMFAHNLEFIEAAQALGAWNDHGKGQPGVTHKATQLSPRSALEVLAFESTLAAIAAGNLASGIQLTQIDRARLLVASSRINRIAEAYR